MTEPDNVLSVESALGMRKTLVTVRYQFRQFLMLSGEDPKLSTVDTRASSTLRAVEKAIWRCTDLIEAFQQLDQPSQE